MKLQVRHRTDYRYSSPVSLAVNELYLTPRSSTAQSCLGTCIEVDPAPQHIASSTDIYGNVVDRFSIDAPHRSCSITATSIVETDDRQPALPDAPTLAELTGCAGSVRSRDALMAADCLLPSRYAPRTRDFDALIEELAPQEGSIVDFAERLMRYIHTHFDYDPSFSTLVTPVSEVFSARRGVCQDFAHLAIAILRRVGIAARYVSGYLETQAPAGSEKLRGADASHAWYAIYVPAYGWVDFDPTNNRQPDAQYVTLAWGRDYNDVSPLRGVVFGGGTHELAVAVDVDRLAV